MLRINIHVVDVIGTIEMLFIRAKSLILNEITRSVATCDYFSSVDIKWVLKFTVRKIITLLVVLFTI